MADVTITLPDGTKKTAAAGTTLQAFAGELKLPFKPVAAELDGLAVDLSAPDYWRLLRLLHPARLGAGA